MDLIFTNAQNARQYAEVVAAWVDSQEDFTQEEFILVMTECLISYGDKLWRQGLRQ